jgi:hypothetical protein
VPESKLHPEVAKFRARLRQQLCRRFCLEAEDGSDAQDEGARAYGVPSFLDPRYRDFRNFNVSDAFVKAETREVLQRALPDMDTSYDCYRRTQRQEERRSEEEKEEGQPGAKRARAGENGTSVRQDDGALSQAQRLLEEMRAKTGTAPEPRRDEEAASTSQQHVKPRAVSTALVEAEFQRYKTALFHPPPQDPREWDPLLWYRKNQGAFPVLPLVAAKYLVLPASASVVDGAFSQAGLINTSIWGAMSAIMLEGNWSDELLNLTRQEVKSLTPQWNAGRPASSGDDVDQNYTGWTLRSQLRWMIVTTKRELTLEED